MVLDNHNTYTISNSQALLQPIIMVFSTRYSYLQN